MSVSLAQSAREHPFAFAVEAVLAVAFFASLVAIGTLPSSASAQALVPHGLMNGGLVLLAVRHFAFDRPKMYWSRLDLGVALLLVWTVAGVHYSEVRGQSWRSASLYADALAGYLFGRMLFYQRLLPFALGSLVALALTAAGCFGVLAKAAAAPPGTAPNPVYLDRVDGVLRVSVLAAVFFAMALPFLRAWRPGRAMFGLFGLVAFGAYGLFAAGRLAWLADSGSTAAAVIDRHSRYANLETAWRIVANYPVTGCGLGTFPTLFDSYRESPTVPFLSNLNTYVYALVETGIVGLALLAYAWFRLPAHALRQWALFPNRRLRMAVAVWTAFITLVALHALIDAAVFHPAAWLLLWTNHGVLASLVLVRDPGRIFDSPFVQTRRAVSSGELPPPDRRRSADFRPLPGSALARHAGEAWRRRMAEDPAAREAAVARAAAAGRRRRPAGGTGQLALALGSALPVVAFVLQGLPYLAERRARPAAGESDTGGNAIRRLEASLALYPFQSDTWARLAEARRAGAAGALDLVRVAPAADADYGRAIAQNPYRPIYAERLYDLRRETGEPAKALAALKDGVRANPNDLVLRLLLVRELERAGGLALATYHVRQAVTRIDPEQTELYVRLAELYEQRGMAAAARRWLQYARQSAPDTPEVRERLRRLGGRLG